MAKRIFDVVMAAALLVALTPVLLALALAVALSSPGPVFYRGVRVGHWGRVFRIFKFRTMVADAESRGGSSTPENDARITRVGALLRRYKLDELPQLLNVLAGHMSLVGPRPQVPWAVALYSGRERALLSVRPGITDLASIRFSNEGEILRGSADPDADYLRLIAPEKKRLALRYVERQSLWLDLRILLATAWKLCGGDPGPFLSSQPTGNTIPSKADYEHQTVANRS